MALIAGGAIWVIGLGSVFSNNIWSDFTPLSSIPVFEGATIFRIVDYFVVNNLILVSAFFITIFTGWVMSTSSTVDELGLGAGMRYRIWQITMRYFAPIAILLISFMTIIGVS